MSNVNLVQRLEKAYDDALHVDSLIAILRDIDISEVDQGHFLFGMDVLAEKADLLSASIDDIASFAKSEANAED